MEGRERRKGEREGREDRGRVGIEYRNLLKRAGEVAALSFSALVSFSASVNHLYSSSAESSMRPLHWEPSLH